MRGHSGVGPGIGPLLRHVAGVRRARWTASVRHLSTACLLALLLPMSAKRAAADEARWVIDPLGSEASFSVRVLLVRKVHGEFSALQGFVHRDLASGLADVEARIDTRQLRMNNPDHAEWARSAEFFDSARHPTIHFQSAPFALDMLHSGGPLVGTLTLRGVAAAVQFQLLPSECKRPGVDCAVRAEGDLARSVFGMDARRYAVADKVRLTLAIRVQAAAGARPGRRP